MGPCKIDYTRMTMREFREFFPFRPGDGGTYRDRQVTISSWPYLDNDDLPKVIVNRRSDGEETLLEVSTHDVSKWREPRLERGLGRTPTTPTFEGIAIALDELHKKVDALAARVG